MLMPSIFGNDFMNDFFGGFPYKSNGTMQTDVSETDKGYKVTMNLPGYQKEDIKGEVKDGYLTVTATTSKNNDEKDKDGKYIRKERYSGSCSRSASVTDLLFPTQTGVKWLQRNSPDFCNMKRRSQKKNCAIIIFYGMN